MTTSQVNASYRWNTTGAADAYDAAAPVIHPYYMVVQDEVLAALRANGLRNGDEFLLVDLGGGSGRFVERFLERFPQASAVVVDQSEPFLALAERRLARFGARAKVVLSRLQDDWWSKLPGPPRAIVSMSAIHHLSPAEKRALYARCYEALVPGGVFVNGDEFRPESDVEYRQILEWWGEHMQSSIDAGRIPKSFQQTLDFWYDKNIRRFGEAKQSGDDCHETLAVQREYLRTSGSQSANVLWNADLWAVLKSHKSAFSTENLTSGQR
jgi:cyclopropane fatty-acyl-phospholipid synthase-like methyltransferase